MKIIPSTAEAITFLRSAHPQGPYHLFAIDPRGRSVARTFDESEMTEMTHWVDDHQLHANIYFHVARLRPGIRNKKAKKKDVQETSFLHVDHDHPDSLTRIKSFVPSPTVIVFSGGGYHAYWKLSKPCTDLDAVERRNVWLAEQLGGDNCHNIDRIMRLPGTVNLPNAKKRKAGRVPTLAKVVDADWSRVYDISDFPMRESTRSAPNATPTTVTPVQLDALPESVGTMIRGVIEHGDDFERPRGSETARYPSRSEAVFHVACELVRAGCDEQTIAGILINPELGISASVLEKRDPPANALREARSAKAAVGDGWPDADKKGNPRPTMRNAAVAIRRLEISCAFDLFRHRKIVGGQALEDQQGELSDDACMVLRGLIIDRFEFDPRSEHVRDAVTLLCLASTFHPIRDMLDELVWDKERRLDKWLTTYLGAEDTPLHAAYARSVLIAAVRRVRQPGVKFDEILVLEGPQGSGKSTALSILAGPGNHSDQEILTADAKTQMELLEGVWIYELGEIEGFNKAEVNRIKAFASRTEERSRMAYARFAVARPRQAIFIGTTNEEKYLRDQTGNRRFWPVKTGLIDLEALRRDRDQLLAEAAYRERQGESIALPPELWEAAAVEQAGRLEDDPWIDILAKEGGQANGDVVRVGTAYLLSKLGIEVERQNQSHTKRIAALMRKLGWTSLKYRAGNETIRGYERPRGDDHHDKQEF